jgi:nucleoid-associated protein YejK
MPINLEQLSINRIIVHEIFGHEPIAEKTVPIKGTELEILSADAKTAVQDRIIQVLGRHSQSVEVDVEDDAETSTFQACVRLIDIEEQEFIDFSYQLALRLADAQATKSSAPGGLVVVFDGTVGTNARRFIAILKAEKQGGFVRRSGEKHNALQYLNEIFMTEDAKLYKIAFFQEEETSSDKGFRDSKHFTVMVYDHLITREKKEKAAQYFYQKFLGCAFPKSGKALTRKFYLETMGFIRSADVSDEDKYDLGQATRTYVKVNQERIIDYPKFAADYMKPVLQDAYTDHMAKAGLPPNSFPKDISLLETELKRRSITWDGKIRLSAPSDIFRDKIEVQPPTDGSQVTTIKVHGRITEQK